MFLTLKPTWANDVIEEQFILRLSQDITKGISNNLCQNTIIMLKEHIMCRVTMKAWNYTNGRQ